MHSLIHPETYLKQKDFYLLAGMYCSEIEKLLPVKGTVEFWGQHWGNDYEKGWYGDKKLIARLGKRCEVLKPGIEKGRLILPINIGDGENIAAIIKDVDPGLLKKMAPEWLKEFTGLVQAKLLARREVIVDPATGLYNSQLLNIVLHDLSRKKFPRALFLICAEYKNRSAAALFQKTVQVARIIDVISQAPAFYVGSNIFCLFHENLSRHGSLQVAHRLLNHLKREGLHRAHIGISVQDNTQVAVEPESILQECWQAMEAAERRGPFSLCEAAYLQDSEKLPLALPTSQIIASLRRKWRGVDRFGLILLSVEKNTKENGRRIQLDKTVAVGLPEDATIVSVSPLEGYIFVPHYNEEQTLALAKKVKAKLEKKHASQSVALGICIWPFHNHTKTETAVNCRKALMHGKFYGPGAVTVFDHVSLNVSGDYLFDEGDYRQAVRDYRNGVHIAPEDTNLMNSMGVALTSLNRLREAVSCFDRVLIEDPKNFMALVNKGFAQRMLCNNEEALQCFEKATQHREFSNSSVLSELSLQLGRLYCDAGLYDMALGALDGYREHPGSRNEYSLYRLLGEAYAGKKQTVKAIHALQKAIQQNPHDALSLSLLGELYALDEQGDDIALTLCQQAVDIDDASWQHWYRLALVKKKIGQLQGARNAIMESLKRNRRQVDALYLSAEIYMELGDERKARGKFQRVINIDPTHRGAIKAMHNRKKKK